MMHEQRQEQNDRNWNSDKPQQQAFSETHDILHKSVLPIETTQVIGFGSGAA
jgi:hypothetical protein